MNLLFITLAQISCHTVYRTLLEKMVSQQFLICAKSRQMDGRSFESTGPSRYSHDEHFKDDFDLEHFRQLMARDNSVSKMNSQGCLRTV